MKEISLIHKNEKNWSRLAIGQGSPAIEPGELFHIKGDFKIGPDSEFGFKIHGTAMIYNALHISGTWIKKLR